MKVRMNTAAGDIVIAMNTTEAPKTTANFVRYVDDGFYDGTVFHRVISGFMVQGGGFEPGMRQKSTRENIENEADNGLKNTKGTVAMARTPDPHSASAQFFINCSDNDFLNFEAKSPQGWGYCVFGEVVEGMDVVAQIEAMRTGNSAGHQDVPVEDVVISKAATEND